MWGASVAFASIVVAAMVWFEWTTSTLQARIFSGMAADAAYTVEAGASEQIRFPEYGPYNDRLGYSRMGAFTERLLPNSFVVDSQARLSDEHRRLVDLGLFPIYQEKDQAGLSILDRSEEPLFTAVYPARVYEDFDAIPPLIWQTLLFIENRELLDERHPRQNPAVEWDRFVRALFLQVLSQFGLVESGPGASTLATQLEKFRHSPGGLTGSTGEKLRQMMAASVRAYREGPLTLGARKQIVTAYINSLPLAGRPGYGEITGLAEGLQTWFGSPFDDVNRVLLTYDSTSAASEELAAYYRQVVTLLLATRRPSYLLGEEAGYRQLEVTTDRYLRRLAKEGIISENLARRSAEAREPILVSPALDPPLSFVGRKAATAVRTEMLSSLDLGTVYELDHFDLTVRTTFEGRVQRAVTEALAQLGDPEVVRNRGMHGARLLGSQDPADVYYAITLYEAAPDGNRLLVQTDNFDGPFNVNAGSKLELGSTAKLRTLVNYLQIVESLHAEYGGRSGGELRGVEVSRSDRITRWAVDYLRQNPGAGLREMLNAALDRSYSASPYEQFFTGGGVHVFHNFSSSDSTGVYRVRTGFRHSVNLVFIRLMQDVVNYYTARLPGNPAAMLDDPSDQRRAVYLARFADREGRSFLWQFYRKYRDLSDEEMWSTYVEDHRPTPRQFARAVRAVREELTEQDFGALLAEHGFVLSAAAATDLYTSSDMSSLNWQDRGYLASVHPLELWYLRYRHSHPDADWNQVVPASTSERQEVYGWLFTSTSQSGQNTRIRTLIEEEAFADVHKAWAAAGYPFERLVPSLATAIGSSADRPQALAELVGIILRGGLKYETLRIQSLHFADDTPYETALSFRARAPERILSEDVAIVLKEALVDVVEHGTAVRIRGGLVDANGKPILVGGKTGTGDNRVKQYNAGGRAIGSEVRSRTSTFVFFIGDDLFGTVTAYVTGPQAEKFRFTSSLPVQLLKSLGPELAPLL